MSATRNRLMTTTARAPSSAREPASGPTRALHETLGRMAKMLEENGAAGRATVFVPRRIYAGLTAADLRSLPYDVREVRPYVR
jgi:hypothetical protein